MGFNKLCVELRTTNLEKGTKIEVVGQREAAVVIQENGEERILLPIKNSYSDSTYYYENTSGLAETKEGYIGFYKGSPDQIKLIS